MWFNLYGSLGLGTALGGGGVWLRVVRLVVGLWLPVVDRLVVPVFPVGVF